MSPTVLDLFSGCGGFSLGFQQAGYDIVAFVEMWKPAIETYKLNHPNAKHLGYDITKVKDEELLEYRNKIDVIIGGPPCQGFSLAGKRNKEDNRNQLYKEYLRFVEIINPKTIVMENVQGILTMRDKDNEKIINKILKDLIRLEYLVTFKKIKPIYIHPYYNRLLTPRELARIQSFPDEFIFTGSKTSMVKQIGNAVPPKLAKEIANDLFKD